MSSETCADCAYLFHVDGKDRWLPVCRRRSPTSEGWPIVRSIDRCGEFKSRDEGPKVTKLGQEPDAMSDKWTGNIQVCGGQLTPAMRAILRRIKGCGEHLPQSATQLVMSFTREEIESIGDV